MEKLFANQIVLGKLKKGSANHPQANRKGLCVEHILPTYLAALHKAFRQ